MRVKCSIVDVTIRVRARVRITVSVRETFTLRPRVWRSRVMVTVAA